MDDKSLDTQINARRIKFVNSKTCINIIIIMLFYTNCTCGLAKANLGYLNGTKISSIGGGGPRAPPLNTPMVLSALTSAPLSGNDGSPVGVTPGATTGLDILLSAKKWAKRSAIEVAADEEGKSEAHLIAF